MIMAVELAPAPPRAKDALRAAAAELKALARRVPLWDPFEVEEWDAFRFRRLAAERALAARLARMPGCTVALSDDGWEVDLTLAGIRIRSRERLHGACMAWGGGGLPLIAPRSGWGRSPRLGPDLGAGPPRLRSSSRVGPSSGQATGGRRCPRSEAAHRSGWTSWRTCA